MSNVQIGAYCMVCERQTMHQKPRINHVLHLILSVLTLGLWAVFVWLPLGVYNSMKRPQCSQCGSQVTGKQILNEAGMNVTPTAKRAPFEPRERQPPSTQPPPGPLPPPRP